jgi:TetR/AcrR family transcriptional regulator, repressor of fatR-cypB operon
MKQKDSQKLEAIFNATLTLVSQVGLAGITMSDIAKEAKIGTGTLYVYFKTKDELIAELYNKCKKTSYTHFFKNYDKNEPFKIGFKRIWLNMFQYRLNRFSEALFVEHFYHSPFITNEVKIATSQLIKPLFDLAERGKSEQVFKNIDTMLLLTYMVGTINELVNLSIYNQTELSQNTIETAFQMCWDGLKS